MGCFRTCRPGGSPAYKRERSWSNFNLELRATLADIRGSFQDLRKSRLSTSRSRSSAKSRSSATTVSENSEVIHRSRPSRHRSSNGHSSSKFRRGSSTTKAKKTILHRSSCELEGSTPEHALYNSGKIYLEQKKYDFALVEFNLCKVLHWCSPWYMLPFSHPVLSRSHCRTPAEPDSREARGY